MWRYLGVLFFVKKINIFKKLFFFKHHINPPSLYPTSLVCTNLQVHHLLVFINAFLKIESWAKKKQIKMNECHVYSPASVLLPAFFNSNVYICNGWMVSDGSRRLSWRIRWKTWKDLLQEDYGQSMKSERYLGLVSY